MARPPTPTTTVLVNRAPVLTLRATWPSNYNSRSFVFSKSPFGDTDTNACIAGTLAGTVWGGASFPTQWTRTLLACKSPRPPAYSCHDLLELAEAFVKVGANAGP
jgi:hypothetical protein